MESRKFEGSQLIEHQMNEVIRRKRSASPSAARFASNSMPPQADDHAHYWVFLYDELWVCKVCNELRWMPDYGDAGVFSNALGKGSFRSVYKRMIKGRDQECIIKLMEDSINGRAD